MSTSLAIELSAAGAVVVVAATAVVTGAVVVTGAAVSSPDEHAAATIASCEANHTDHRPAMVARLER